MTQPPPIDVALQRRRLILMLAINGVCILIAVAAGIGFLQRHAAWMGAVFALALVAGFGAHFWLLLGMKRRG